MKGGAKSPEGRNGFEDTLVIAGLSNPCVVTAHWVRVCGLQLVGMHLSGGWEGFSKERQVEDLDPKEMMVQRGSPWVVKGAATASGHLHPRRDPDCVNWSSCGIAIAICRGIAVAVNVKDGVAETPSTKRMGKAAQLDIRVVVDNWNNFVPKSKSCADGLECVFVEEHEGIRGGRARNTGCGWVSELLGPDGAALVW